MPVTDRAGAGAGLAQVRPRRATRPIERAVYRIAIEDMFMMGVWRKRAGVKDEMFFRSKRCSALKRTSVGGKEDGLKKLSKRGFLYMEVK